MDYKEISIKIEEELQTLFEELTSGIAAREDSRAFGAMIEKRITENWAEICNKLNYKPIDLP